MKSLVRSILRLAGKGDDPVAAVFGFTAAGCHRAAAYLRREQPNLPVWIYSTAELPPETVALCERVVVRPNAAALWVEAQSGLWRRKVALCAGTWTGERGGWLVKAAPFTVPPFRALLLNGNGDFLPGKPRMVAAHFGRLVRDRAYSSWCTAKYGTAAVSLLATATVLNWLRNPHWRVLRRLRGGERLMLPLALESGGGAVEFEQGASGWDGRALRELVECSGARWIAWRMGGAREGIEDMLPLLEDPRTFAVARQRYARGWKEMLRATAAFRKLQSGEAARVAAPMGKTIVVSREKLAQLGVPEDGPPGAAWRLLFWKAAAAGWRSYGIGGEDAVTPEPDAPVEETAFVLRVLRKAALRRLGARDHELSRGNIAFQARRWRAERRHWERPRVLVVSPFLPYPLSHGGAVRIYNLCRALSAEVEFALIAIREAGETVDYEKLHEVFHDVRIVDLDERRSSDGALPAQVRGYASESLRALVAERCRTWKPEVLQIEYTHLAGLRECSAGAPAILVEHDFTAGLYRQIAAREGTEAARAEYERWRRFELGWLEQYEGVWAVSEEERGTILRESGRGGERTFVVENGVDTARFEAGAARATAPEILFVGSFRHRPNVLAYEMLRDEIMPQVWRQVPDALLRVVAGPKPEEFERMFAARQRSADDRVEVLGFVEDLRPLYARAAVVAVPLAVSSGTNIKVLEAMASGKAIVSTPAGCAGLGLRAGQELLVAEEPAAFADAVCAVLGDAELAGRLGAAARRTTEERFDWGSIAQTALESYRAVLGRRAPESSAMAGD